MAHEQLTVLGISGSLRQKSMNSGALRAAIELAPPGMSIEAFGLEPIPMYNDDVREQGYPPPVQDLRERIRAADALLLVSPEYNYSIPGVLKNAIDWASRPPDQPFNKKPIAIMGASPSSLGTGRAQYHLRQVFIYLDGMILNRPEVMISSGGKFDSDGNLNDQKSRDHIRGMLEALGEWTRLLRRGAARS